MKIEGAFANPVLVSSFKHKCKGAAPSGIRIEGYYAKPDGSALTAWPVRDERKSKYYSWPALLRQPLLE